MIFRFLGKFFLYFVIIPEIVKTYKQIVRPALAAGIVKAIEKDAEKMKEEKAKSRADHPAGSRRSE